MPVYYCEARTKAEMTFKASSKEVAERVMMDYVKMEYDEELEWTISANLIKERD